MLQIMQISQNFNSISELDSYFRDVIFSKYYEFVEEYPSYYVNPFGWTKNGNMTSWSGINLNVEALVNEKDGVINFAYEFKEIC